MEPKFKKFKVMTKARTRWGIDYPAKETEYDVEVGVGESITVFKGGKMGSSFVIGSMAEYDSYNLSYLGTITKITEKTVQIKEEYQEKYHNLDMNTFCWRNWDFDLEDTNAKNANTMLYI